MYSRVAIALLTCWLCATACGAQSAKNDAEQQEKDFEQKQRIYGTKHPWENTAPYGTQYTPPQAGGEGAASGESSGPSSSAPETKPAPKPPAKPAAKKKSATHTRVKKHKASSKPKASSGKTK